MRKKISLTTSVKASGMAIQQESKKIPFEKQTPVELIQRNPKHQFGNRPDYYTRRGTSMEGVDSRVLSLEESYFAGKKVLDIGCHAGIVTLQIAKHYKPASIKGIDIDYRLVNEAVRHWTSEDSLAQVEKARKLESTGKEINKKLDLLKTFPKNIKESCPEMASLLGKRDQQSHSSMDIETEYPHNVSFEIVNILDLDETKEKTKYDTVVCFSLTKWVHLNYGDEGIKKMFQKIKMCLAWGGLLILEVQKHKSYIKKIKDFPRFKEIFANIEFLPENFGEYLTKELGFQRVTTLETKNLEEFKRDVEVYRL